MDLGDVLDQLAFAGLKPKELVARIAANLTGKTLRSVTQQEIETHIAQLVAKYGGRLGGMTRKNLVAMVGRRLKIHEQRRWKNTQAWLNSLKSDDAPSA